MSQTPDPIFDKLVQQFNQNIPEGIRSSQLPKVNYVYHSIDFGTVPGFPAVRFLCPELQMDIRVCTSPIIGASDTYIDSLFYTVVVLCPEKVSTRKVSLAIAGLLETSPMIAIRNHQEELHKNAPDVDTANQQFAILMHRDIDELDDMYAYHAMASVEVGPELIARNITFMQKQIDDMKEIYSTTKSIPPATDDI